MKAALVVPPQAIRHLLAAMKADVNEDGSPVLSESSFFVGSDGDFVIPEGTKYYVDGEPHDLVGELRLAGEGIMIGGVF